jgi:hypothetical protein
VLRYAYIACLVLLIVEIRLKILFVWLVLVFVRVVCPTVRMVLTLILLFDEGNQKPVIIMT